MKIPYGIADFYSLITDRYVYVDRTAHVRTLESLGRALLFVRPRRFGKSLWLKTLRCYYDLALANEHKKLFGRLAIGRDPTPLAHRYFVLEWDFSAVDAQGGAEEIGAGLHDYVNRRIRTFVSDYRDHLPESVALEDDAVLSLDALLAVLRQTPYKLYLLIDEYDNFANEVMVSDEGAYQDLLHADGPYKRLMKWVKSAMAGQGLERLFMTGVSPVVMSDLTSGLNICENVSLDEELSELCGFTEDEVEGLLLQIAGERSGTATEPPAFSIDEGLEMLRIWYDGYRFAPAARQPVYNPTLALYFLKHLYRKGRYPEQMLDTNLAADEDKLDYLARIIPGQQAVMDLLQTGRPLEIAKLEERFTLADMVRRSSQDRTFLASFLYYFGMLTLSGRTEFRALQLQPPNLVVKTLYIDQVLRFLMPDGADRTAIADPVRSLKQDGGIEPLLRLVEEKLFRIFSNRDYRWMNEHAVKMAFLALVFDDVSYMIHSEAELDRGYADLCLLLRPDARSSRLRDLLFEFKYVKLDELEMSGQQLRALDREELDSLAPVEAALAAAGTQLGHYRRALTERFGGRLKLRAYAVVALGFERLLGREITSE